MHVCGVALFIKDSIDSKESNLNTTLEEVAAEMSLPNKIHLCSIYLPNSQDFNIDEIKDLIDQLPKPFIMMGDFSCHHTCWGLHKIDQRGKIIEKVIDYNPLVAIINNNEYTHFNISNGTLSAIDLTLVSTSIALKTE